MVTHHADTCRHAHSESMSCSIVNSELLFDNGAMEYVSTTYGERRRVHREYVDVYARFGRDGAIEPVCIMWKDGRSFSVDEVIESSGFGIMSRGRQSARYRVRFGRHETDLYLERRAPDPAQGTEERLMWWVYAYDVTKIREASC